MFEYLHEHISVRIDLTDEEFDIAAGFFTPKKFRKHQYFLQEGDVCRYIAFVNSGCLRQYSIDYKGNEHIVQFAVKDWWIGDLNSYLSGRPSEFNIDALKNSEILMLEKDAREKLLITIPKMERFFRQLLEANHVAAQQRITESLAASAEERYIKFISTYPELLEQIPQHQVASYLGITPQSLSRIRKDLSNKP